MARIKQTAVKSSAVGKVPAHRPATKGKKLATKSARKVAEGPSEADAIHEGLAEERSSGGHHQEGPPLSSRNCGTPRNPPVPEVDGPADAEATIPTTRPGSVAGLQDGSPVPIVRHPRPTRSLRSLPHFAVRGHQLMRNPCQAGHHYGEGHEARPPHPRRTSELRPSS
ncbi:hypothetical protein L596_014082 [Steinernema carpocapsae]|uniref:Uncharacterized protein n=1 Tax=Steinernema carpocapsae TaxID=34508 RepID=A0A4U5NBD9_STECR|nr:hypothetical protein L596_014082 [Steinernema carpocapsae]